MAFSDQESPYAGGGFVALLAGYGASYLLGANVWLPLLLSFGAIFGISRLLPRIGDFLRFAAGVAIGQLLWMIIGVLVQPEMISNLALDLVLGLGLVGWCLIRPSKLAVALLILLQVASLVVNLQTAMQIGEWGPMMAAILVHIALRTGVMVLAIMALKEGLLRSYVADDEVEEVFS